MHNLLLDYDINIHNILIRVEKIENLIILLVIFAAFLHAFWNFILKGSSDKSLTMTSVVLGHLPMSFFCLSFFGFPTYESFHLIISSAVLHFFYQIFLLNAYKHGEFSEVYPIARGLAPLIITIFTSIFLFEKITIFELIGIFCISLSVISYGTRISLKSRTNFRGFRFAVITGFFIALYSIIDGYGARISQNPFGFYSTMTILNAIIYLIYTFFFQKSILTKLLANSKKHFWVGGSASFIAYAIVVCACVYLPIAIVSSLRETSIIFALGLSTFFLKEKINLFKILIFVTIITGIVLLRFKI